MKDRYQLIIAGAGPAGAYAALTAARAGIDVLLLERSQRGKKPLTCGEAVSHDGLTRFIEPDPAFISSNVDAIGLTVATGYEFVYRMPTCFGYVLDRPKFDTCLADRAAGFGAEVVNGAYVCGIDIDETGPATITVKIRDRLEKVRGDYIIAADGVESMVGRMAGINTLLKMTQADACLQYRVSGVEVDANCLEFCVGEKYSPDNYLWIFPKSDNSANIGLGLNPSGNDISQIRSRLESFLEERYGDYTIDFECCGVVPKFTGLEILGRKNLLLAGDAARTIDSLTGAGNCRALHTGQLAARSVMAVLGGEIDRGELVGHYTGAVDRELGRDLRFFKKAQEVFRKFDDDDWESLARFLHRFLSKQKAGSVDPAALVKSAFAGAPRLMRLARHLF